MAGRLLAGLPVADLTIEEPPIERGDRGRLRATVDRRRPTEADRDGRDRRRTATAPGPAARPTFGRFSPRALADYYRRQFASSLAVKLAYRGAMGIWVFTTVIQPLVFIVVWTTVAGSGSAGGYTASQFVAYFLTMMVVDHLTFIWHMWEFEWRIRTGAFSPLLLRPVHPIHNDICENLSYKMVGLVGILPAAAVLAVIFSADFGGTSLGERRWPSRRHSSWPWRCASWSSGAWPWPPSG